MDEALAPEAVGAIRQAEQRGRPSVHLLPVSEGRRFFAAESVPIGKVPQVDRVDELWLGASVPARLYRPAGTNLPVVVFLHGGGWVLGDLDTHDLLCRTLASESGCAVLSVGYRRAPEHPYPAAVDDAQTALSWVITDGRSFALDADRIAVAGDSAGGNLAVALAQRAASGGFDVTFQLLFYPVTTTDLDVGLDPDYDGLVLSRDELVWHQDLYLPDRAARRTPEASPLDAADLSVLPPAFVIAAECDPIAPQSRQYVDALTAAGVPARLRTWSGMIHGFVQYPDRFTAARAALAEAGRALSEALAPPTTAPPHPQAPHTHQPSI